GSVDRGAAAAGADCWVWHRTGTGISRAQQRSGLQPDLALHWSAGFTVRRQWSRGVPDAFGAQVGDSQVQDFCAAKLRRVETQVGFGTGVLQKLALGGQAGGVPRDVGTPLL